MRASIKYLIFAVFLVLCGCATNIESNNKGETNNLSKCDSNPEYTYFPSSYNSNEGSITFNTTINVDKVSFVLSNASYKSDIDYDLLGKELMKSEELSDYSSDGNIKYTLENGDIYEHPKESGYIRFYTSDYAKVRNSFCMDASRKYNVDLFETPCNFSFATEEEALNEIEDFLKQYNINIEDFKIKT